MSTQNDKNHPPLSSFIAQILSPSSSSSIELDSITLDSKKIQNLLSQIDVETALFKRKLYATILDNIDEFTNSYTRSGEISLRLSNLFEELDRVRVDVTSDETGIKSLVVDALQQQSNAKEELLMNSALVEATEYLVEISEFIKQFEELRKANRVKEVADLVLKVEHKVALVSEGRVFSGAEPHVLKIVEILQDKVVYMKDAVDQLLEDLLMKAIHFEAGPDHQYRVTIMSELVSSSSGELITLEQIFEALTNFGFLEPRMSFLKRNIMKYIVNPLFEKNDATSRSLHIENIQLQTASLILSAKSFETQSSLNKDLLSSLSLLFKFLYTHLPAGYSAFVPRHLGKLLLPDIVPLVTTEILEDSVPDSIEGLEGYADLAEMTRQFEASLIEMGFQAPPKIDTDDDEQPPLTTYVSNVELHFVVRRKKALFISVRNGVLYGRWEPATEEIGMKPTDVWEIAEVVGGEKDEAAAPEMVESMPQTTKTEYSGNAGKDENDVDDTRKVDEIDDDIANNGWGDDINLTIDVTDFKQPVQNPKEREEKINPSIDDENGWGDDTNLDINLLSAPSQQADGKGWEAELDMDWNSLSNTDSVAKVESSHKISPKAYSITATPSHLLRLVRFTLTEANRLNHPMSRYRLALATLDILDFYRAIMSVYHKHVLENIPAVALLLRNDCFWLAEQIGKIVSEYLEVIDGNFFDKTVRKLLEIGDGWFEFQTAKQRDVVLECLADADGFLDAALPKNAEKCKRAIEQVIFTIRHLAKLLKGDLDKGRPLLTELVYWDMMGRVVDTVIEKMIEDIERLVDIGVDESTVLGEVLKSALVIEDVFVEDPLWKSKPTELQRVNGIVILPVPLIEQYVPNWTKFRKLGDMLIMSMGEIMAMFRVGGLREFSVKELEGLICALFANTPLRTRNLDELQRGHPLH